MYELKIKWSKKEQDFVIYYPRKADGHLAHQFISRKNLEILIKDTVNYGDMKERYSLVENPYLKVFETLSIVDQLKNRGYDITTLKFSVKLSAETIKELEKVREKN